MTAGIAVAKRFIADQGSSSQAEGLLGRGHKQAYMEHAGAASGPVPPAIAAHLMNAIDRYKSARDIATQNKNDTDRRWGAVNIVALLERARHDELPEGTGSGEKAAVLAESIRQELTANTGGGDPWTAATLGEACLALGRWEEAAKAFAAYAGHADIKPFQLAGTIRQLEQVWRINRLAPEAAGIVDGMRTALARMEGGRVELYNSTADDDGTPESLGRRATTYTTFLQAEALVGGASPPSVDWWEEGLQWTRSVARIRLRNGKTWGTGFLVAGEAFDPRLKGQRFVLTNHHVVCSDENVDSNAIGWREAQIVFDRVRTKQKPAFSCTGIASYSTFGEADYALLKLATADEAASKALKSLKPLKFASESETLPPLTVEDLDHATKQWVTRASRVYIFGYPLGQELCISLDNNRVIARGKKANAKATNTNEYLHYLAPTESGNSGSPVFREDKWEVVALHHASVVQGGTTITDYSLEHRSPLGKAIAKVNEGIAIQSIRQAVRRDLASGKFKP